MFVLVAVNLVAIPLALLSRPHAGVIAQAAVPGVKGGLPPGVVLFVIALVGTTVAPWQLFFHQSNVVDKRITARWLAYERVDTLIGTFCFALGATAILVTCAFAFDGTQLHGTFVDARAVADGLTGRFGAPAGALFALLLLNASVLGAGVVTLSTSYAIGDVLGVRHSLHRRWRDARVFHGSFAVVVAGAVAIVLLPGLPLGIVTMSVQALAGVLLPSASVFLLLLCNDRAVLGPWTNPRWLNCVATVVVGSLLVLSALLTLTTLLPSLDVRAIAAALTGGLVVVLGVLGVASLRRRRGREPFSGTPWERGTWTMPRLETLAPPAVSRARTTGLVVLRVYLLIAALALIVKAVQLALSA
jgi:Mn2+/Fe2+ NRAMP family transporter